MPGQVPLPGGWRASGDAPILLMPRRSPTTTAHPTRRESSPVHAPPAVHPGPSPGAPPSPGIAWAPAEAVRLLDCALDAIVGCAPDGTIRFFNTAAERLYGRARVEVLGAPLALLFDPAQGGADTAAARHVLGGGGVPHRESVHAHADGSPIEVSVTFSPLPGADGGVGGCSLVVRDVAARRLVERELARTRQLLEEHAVELTRSNADLEQFAYVASHDLSEPLRTITGMLSLLEQETAGRLAPDALDYIRRAVSGAERMRRLIDDLLRFGRVGRAVPAREPVELEAVLAAAVESLGAAVRPACTVVATTPLPVVTGDRDALRQVLENLISNGLKFGSGPGPRVEVSARRGQGAWEITVADDGIGIPPRHATRVFEVFKRLHTRDAYEGTGIGLAIVQRLVERGGGRAWVEAHDGPGARLTFSVPDDQPTEAATCTR